MRIAAVKHAVPSMVVTNDDVLHWIRRDSADLLSPEDLEEVLRRVRQFLRLCGTKVRYGLDEDESALGLVLDATERALAEAGIEPEDVDFLIYTGVGRGWIEPAMANVVQNEVGMSGAFCFDILDACASWLQAMQVAHSFLAGGRYRTGVVVNCEGAFMGYADWAVSSVEELEHKFAAYTVGEAATATVLTATDEPDDFYFRMKSFGEYFDRCMIPLPTAAKYAPKPIDERAVPGRFFSLSTELITTTVGLILEEFNADPVLKAWDPDIGFAHQASDAASSFVRKATYPHKAKEQYFATHSRFGNTVSASVPLGMSVAVDEGRLKRGDKVIAIVGSAGISVGFATFTF